MSHWCNNHARAVVHSGPHCGCSDIGSSLIETALLMPVLLLLMVGAIDFGRAYTIAIEVSSAAHAGALYGTHNVSDTAGMTDAVEADASDLAENGLTSNATYGCECAEGGSVVSGCTIPPNTCAQNYVNYVQVTAAYVYTPLLPYPVIATKPITLQTTVEMRSGGD